MEGLIDLLLSFVAEQTPYDTTAIAHPVVIEVSQQDLTQQFYRGRAHMMPSDGVEERLNALYVANSDGSDVIFIVAPETIEGAKYFDDPHDNPLWREILLHELVHHAQHAENEETWTCVARGEAEAYQVGAAYLDHLGLPDPMTDREGLWKRLYTSC